MASIGMRHVVAAPISAEGTNAMPTYGTGFIVGRAQRGSIQWERNDNDLYGDDVVAEGDNSITGGRLDVGTTELTEENEQKLLGYLHDQTGDFYEVSDDAAPYVGIGYVQVLKRFGVTIYKGIWYMKAQFGLPSEETKTKEKSIEWGTPTVSGKLFGVYNDASGKAKFRRHKRFTTYAAALTWLDALANYTAPSSSATT